MSESSHDSPQRIASQPVAAAAIKKSGNGIALPAVPAYAGKDNREKPDPAVKIFQPAQLKKTYAPVNQLPFTALQLKKVSEPANITNRFEPVQRKKSGTGLPDNLKTGIESLSGFSMNDVKVHFNSGKPAQLQAHAYAQGTDIHVASGQEKHLPHEAWHVVQQKQGRVKPTVQMKGKVNINDNAALEQEADTMGNKAVQYAGDERQPVPENSIAAFNLQSSGVPIQLMKKWSAEGGFENIDAKPAGAGWTKYKYKGEETYLTVADIPKFTDWEDIDTYDDEVEAVDTAESKKEEKSKPAVDKFAGFKAGEVTSITIMKENRSDHQFVIAMVKGGGNMKMHYGSGGALFERDDDIDNEHGVPVASYGVPDGLTGNQVEAIFNSTKGTIAPKFTGGNCGGLASELVGKIGGTSKGDGFLD